MILQMKVDIKKNKINIYLHTYKYHWWKSPQVVKTELIGTMPFKPTKKTK